MHFGRLLRAAGLPVGTDRIQLALRALPLAGLRTRADVHDALAACLIDRVEHIELFEQAFERFWRTPGPEARATGALPARAPSQAGERRLEQALRPQPDEPAPPASRDEHGSTLAPTAHEALRRIDFETMSVDEWRAARRLLKRLAPLFEPVATRRREHAAHPGQPDPRATLRALARRGGEVWQMRWQRPRRRPAPLVVLADISGSMSRYSRMLLHFTHALGHADLRVESFVFGTRLTRTTRALRQRDPDIALARVVRDVQDWSGGTRITACLHEFNQRWARRVLSGRPTVLLISDGLEHGTPEDPRCARLAFEMERLHKSCRRLLWLNPLLRFAAFQPRAAGIKAMLPHVDQFLPAHNLDSLEQLAHLVAGTQPPRRR
jgi:hypothetical protein